MAPGYRREGRTEDGPFRKLLVARDVDPLDTSAVVSLATDDETTADRANKRLLIHLVRHPRLPSRAWAITASEPTGSCGPARRL